MDHNSFLRDGETRALSQQETQSSSTLLLDTDGTPSNPTFGVSHRIGMGDTCEEIMPAALAKHRIYGRSHQYRLWLICDNTERCLEMSEKPLVLFKRLSKQGKNPRFMLRPVNTELANLSPEALDLNEEISQTRPGSGWTFVHNDADILPRRRPQASILPYVFPPRLCESIRKDGELACISVSNGQSPAQRFLTIDIARSMAISLAREIFEVEMGYSNENTSLVMQFPNGVRASTQDSFTYHGARATALPAVLGSSVFAALDNSIGRRREMESGEAMAQLVELRVSTDPQSSHLRVELDIAAMSGLDSQLWGDDFNSEVWL